jgi:hypothetical protein
VSLVKYELGFYIPEADIRHSHCLENLKCYIALTGWALYRRVNVSPVKYELDFYIRHISYRICAPCHRRRNMLSKFAAAMQTF